jgi:ligand-binding SRPBCC domain-containing protein
MNNTGVNTIIIWQPWQLQFLKDNFENMTAQQLSDAIGIKRTKVREMYYSFGLKKMDLQWWNNEQVEFLKLNYKTIGDTDIANEFSKRWAKEKGWTKKHIEKKRKQLVLKRTPEEISAIKKLNIANGCFAICPIKAWITRGGASAENTIRIWTVNKRKLPFIKINGSYIHWGRHKWIEQYGVIEKGYAVIYADGNPLNMQLSNLALVKREELSKRNLANYYDLPIELKRTIKKIKSLKKQITHAKQNERPRQPSIWTTGKIKRWRPYRWAI